jgi:transcriptional regulator with XRE-family HTH domain
VNPGERLKRVRAQLGLTTREVALLSKKIADAERNPEFLVSGPWLTQIENEKSAVPSIYKLFTLASIYGLAYSSLLATYGVDLKKLNAFHAGMPIEKTHLTEYIEPAESASKYLELPIRFDAGFNLSETNLLSRMIETWGQVPLEFIQHLDLRHRLYGFVGLNDYTLYPLVRPGSFVEIDPELKDLRPRPARSEFDRNIYFVDLRSEYACGWCEIIDNRLLLIAHPLSPSKTRSFEFPQEAEIIGQVTGIAMRVGTAVGETGQEFLKAPSRS